MSLLKNRDTKRSATILRAVPETTACATALHSDQRDMNTHVYLRTNDRRPRPAASQYSSSLAGLENTSFSIQNNNISASTSAQFCPIADVRSVWNNTSLKGAIGTYKNGKIQWRSKDSNSSQGELKDGRSSTRGSKPKIQVVIPNGRRDRPLPSTPFFGTPSKTHAQSIPVGLENVDDVSPPSASNRVIMRDSIVSPISQSSGQPVPFRQFQRSVSQNVWSSKARTARHHMKISDSSNSSYDSHESDASSIYSTHSSETSVETEIAPTSLKSVNSKLTANLPRARNPTVRDFAVFSRSASKVTLAGKSIRQRSPPSIVVPRQYAAHPHIERDVKFQPTCELRPERGAPTSLTRKPTLTRKSSKRGTYIRNLTSNSTMGVINKALKRSTSRRSSDPYRGPSPTLSEAENDLHEQLISLSEDRSLGNVTDDGEYGWSALSEDIPFNWDDVVVRKGTVRCDKSVGVASQPRKDSETIETSFILPPCVPRKSSKRQTVACSNTSHLSRLPRHYVETPLRRGSSLRKGQALTITIPEFKRVSDSFVLSPDDISPKAVKRTISPSDAEAVFLNILHSLDHFEDLFSLAVFNRGFYRVFKRHELDLIKSTLRKMSPPAWEFREIAFPGHDLLHAEDLEMTRPDEEYTSTTYLQLQKQDIRVIRSIKSQIMEQCPYLVRPEITVALLSESPVESARVDNALWRIWTFCKIFGSGKGREEDIVAQMDWLKGGLLVHQDTCTFSIISTDYMNDTLVGASESFGKGNEGGLTAEQLFDMMEIWTCLGVLLQGFEGRTAQAREFGIYDNTEIQGDGIHGEETMLDEWCYHLLTFGPSTVLDLAGLCRQPESYAFMTAAKQGLTSWKPPVLGGTRRNFLKEAATRVYVDIIANTYAKVSTREIQRQQSRLRIQKHISELQQRKNSGERMPIIRMSQERPMSEWDTVIGNLTRPHSTPETANNIVSYIPTLRSAVTQELLVPIAELPATRTPPPSGAPKRTVAQPLLPTPPPSTASSDSDRYSMATSMSSIEEYLAYRKKKNTPEVPSLASHPAFRNMGPPVSAPQSHARQNSDGSVRSHSSSNSGSRSGEHPAFQQHEAQRNIYHSQSYENTADKAIYRIVEMGFTAEQAREALRMTDLGNGLRVDRAVELLLGRLMGGIGGGDHPPMEDDGYKPKDSDSNGGGITRDGRY